MDETKLRQLFKNRADAYLNTIDESVEQGMSEDCFIKAVKEAINYTHCCESDSEQLVCGCGKNKPVRREPAYLHCDWCGSITVETK